MKKTEDINDFDFGFSFVDENYEEVKESKELLTKVNEDSQQQIQDLKSRLEDMYNSIIPFLDNLCKNPEKSTILWPNRVEKIQSYKTKLKSILEGK